MITLQSRITLSDDVLVQEIEGEAVLLDLKSEQYFGLDAVGVRLWHALEANPSLDAAHRALLDAYDVESEQLAGDLIRLVEELARAGLVDARAS